MEIAHVESDELARGTQIGLAYELRWELERSRLRVEILGAARREIELGDADFFDLAYSPFFNSLPVLRDGLLDGAPARDYTMRFVHVPELPDSIATQRYEPLGKRVVHYRSGSFEADIEFDGDCFVTVYDGLAERIA